MNWKSLFKCSTCERLQDVCDLLRLENDNLRLERDQWKQEFFKIVHKLNDIDLSSAKSIPVDPETLKDKKPIRGVSNPRRILRSLEIKDLNTFKDKQKSFEKQVSDA